MAAFLSQTELSRGGLKLFLSNDLGQAQDAASVRWTVYSASGSQMSGKGLPAVKTTVGEYYAPWFTDVSGGSYRIDWEVQEQNCALARTFSENFFVVNPEMYTACGISPSVVVGAGTFRIGQQLGAGDLTLFLRNDDGLLQNAYAVFWTIIGPTKCAVTPRSYAASSGTGSYFAPWLVAVYESGDYSVVWEFQQDADSPLQSTTHGFYVLSPVPSFQIVLSSTCCEPNPQSCTDFIQKRASPVFIVPCGSGFAEADPGFFACGSAARTCAPCLPPASPVPMPNPSPQSCCAFEIPRIVHLATGQLPAGGAYTSQPQYPIPTGVRHITFYITYVRGAPGGQPVFKLLWGNGMEEIQETTLEQCDSNATMNSTLQSLLLQNLEGPVPTDGLPVNFVLYATVPGGSNRVRLIAAEKGMPGIPGTLGITLTAAT
jgi:hypothetical protein